ncbi:MAG: YjgN family protein, partial [Alphaproteobacteria bacterium]|nr:YjgN family protein [Alphaproteobacteria bacterium]
AQIVSFEGVTFSIKANTFSLGWVYAVNFLIIAFTLGLGLPIAQMRLWRYIFKRLEAEGEIDIASIRQNADKGPKSGEGLADAFDIGNVI